MYKISSILWAVLSLAACFAYAKPMAPVNLDYSIPDSIEANETVPVTLTFRSGTPRGRLEISLNARQGLHVIGSQQGSFDLEAETKQIDTEIIAPLEGIYYLNVIALEFGINGEGLLGRAFSIPVKVGKNPSVRPSQKPGKLVRSGSENIIEMPAQVN